MNDSRRKRLSKASAKLDEAIALLEEVRDEEQGDLANLPQDTRQDERNKERAGLTIAALEDAISALEDTFEDAKTCIEEAQRF